MFKGIITPMVTPFNRDVIQSINYDETKKMIDHLIEHKVGGIFILGSNGEFQTLSFFEKLEFIDFVVKYVNKRVPVFSGTGDCNYYEAIELSKRSEELKVDALSIVPPYFIKPTDDEIISYFTDLANSVKIPVILYNIPKNTGYPISNKVLEECLKVENIIGIKDSSGDDEVLISYIDICKKYNKYVWVGSDSKISFAYKLGAIGAIAGTSNLISDVVVGLFDALENNDLELASKLQKDIDVLRAELKKDAVPSILKRSIELAGISKVGPARKPVRDIKGIYDDDLNKMLDFYKLRG